MRYYLELGGGLGDAFQYLYESGVMKWIDRELKPDDQLTIGIVSHNPHVAELFAHHPKRSQMAILQLPYWTDDENEVRRKQFALPPHNPFLYRPCGNAGKQIPNEMLFYCSATDEFEINCLRSVAENRPVVVFSLSAGLPVRDVPPSLANWIATNLYGANFFPVLVGRDYDRHGRKERQSSVFSLVNKLSVPGVARLVQMAAGVVCCHSSVNMLASYERKPQLLLYDEETRLRHFEKPDQWSFMADFPEVTHGTFEAFSPEMLTKFMEAIHVHS